MSKKELLLPALRCHMGGWIYYVTSIKLKDVADRVMLADQLVESPALSDLLQRKLRGRASKIADYLTYQPQHLFSSVVIAVHGGDPTWLELNLKPSKHFDMEGLDEESQARLRDTLGFLRLSGEEKLWALDGQHRVQGIREAIDRNEELGDEELSAIFVGHKKTREGKERTRRLFTTLNRHAKAISKGERIALDEDDACAIITRRLVESHPLLKGNRTASAERAQMQASDIDAFTTIGIIYDVCVRLLADQYVAGRRWKASGLTNGLRPPEPVITQLYDRVALFWTGLSKTFPEIKSYLADKSETGKAQQYRTPDGGNLLFRPAGLDAFSRAFRTLMDNGRTQDQAFEELKGLDYELASDVWAGVLWNQAGRKMLASTGNRSVAGDVLLYQAGALSESALKTLAEEYAELLDLEEPQLPPLPNRESN